MPTIGSVTAGACLVVFRRRVRDLWRRTYWVVCIYCDESHGPRWQQSDAWGVANSFNALGVKPKP